MRSRWLRLFLLVVLCAVPAGVEAGVLRAVGFSSPLSLTPQVSAMWPYGTLHDLRWVLVYHRSWAGFVGESLAAIAVRGLLGTALTALAWPSGVPRPSLARLGARNVVFAAVLGAFLSPWAAMGVVASDVSVSWYVLGELVPVLVMAPVLQRGGMVPGWWRGLPPADTVGLSVLNFAALTAGGVLVWVVPPAFSVAVATVTGGVNGLFWWWAVRIAVRHEGKARWRRVPVAAIVIALVAGFMFTVGDVQESTTRRPEVSEPPALLRLEAEATDGPVIFLAGYNSHYSGEPSGRILPILRYSYRGIEPDGTPRPYPSTATHQSMVDSARLLAAQIDQVHARTGHKVALLAESEGALIAHYYLVTMPHPNVDHVVLLSPPIRAGRIYYPPRHAHTGWGIATGWELRAIFAVLGAVDDLPNSADEPFIRSLTDNAPLFRNNRMLCPVRGVKTIAFLPTLDAAAVPPGVRAKVPVVQIPAPHGLLIQQPAAKQRVVQFLNAGTPDPDLRWDYGAIQRSGAAWQAPPLALSLNPAWANVNGQPPQEFLASSCPNQ